MCGFQFVFRGTGRLALVDDSLELLGRLHVLHHGLQLSECCCLLVLLFLGNFLDDDRISGCFLACYGLRHGRRIFLLLCLRLALALGLSLRLGSFFPGILLGRVLRLSLRLGLGLRLLTIFTTCRCFLGLCCRLRLTTCSICRRWSSGLLLLVLLGNLLCSFGGSDGLGTFQCCLFLLLLRIALRRLRTHAFEELQQGGVAEVFGIGHR
mmetsp:Transcript_138418/g.442356  ORF Transcript_138418/g.442356 Transcript_138418/m.442356 type:complete len:209 (+) Transcript_138418:2046-2672(+)